MAHFSLLDKTCLIVEDTESRRIVDLEALARAGMRAKRVSTLARALHELSSASWDALLVDLDLSEGTAMTVVNGALELPTPRPAILTTSTSAEPSVVVGACALALPVVPKAHLTDAVVMWIGAVLGVAPSKQGSSEIHVYRASSESSTRGRELSARESVVFGLLTHGLAPKEIAHRLGIGHATVRTLARRAYRKLGAANLREAIAAHRMGRFEDGTATQARIGLADS